MDTRWMDVDKLLQPSPKRQEELKQRAVQDIALARYEFPSTELPSYRTFVNVPETTLPVTDEFGNQLTPDIVVVDTPGNILKILAQVETADGVNDEQALKVWLRYANLPETAFYVYVPVGYGGRAKAICRRLGVDVYGYRTWRYTPQGVEVNDISEPPGIIHALMPKFARKLMRGMGP